MRVEDFGQEGASAIREGVGGGVSDFNVSVDLATDENALSIVVNKIDIRVDPALVVGLAIVISGLKSNDQSQVYHHTAPSSAPSPLPAPQTRSFLLNLQVDSVSFQLSSSLTATPLPLILSLHFIGIGARLSHTNTTNGSFGISSIRVVDERNKVAVFHPTSSSPSSQFLSLSVNQSGKSISSTFEIGSNIAIISPTLLHSLISIWKEVKSGLDRQGQQHQQKLIFHQHLKSQRANDGRAR
jgi:hypothetical protein